MSAFVLSSPALEAARAAYAAHARAQSEFLVLIARGGVLDDAVSIAALAGAVDAGTTAMKRTSELIDMAAALRAASAAGDAHG